MGFKSDRELLRNITIGAVGTRQVARLLNQAGFRVIELERCATSNKIWATKVKRLRVPDLLCIKSGIRIESRGKSTLKVTMSHAVNNPQRAWDAGLREDDLVAFIHCTPTGETAWAPSDEIRLFRVSDMRATAGAAGLSQMKAASEGSEIQLTWPATIPGRAGEVLSVTESAVEVLQDSGRRQRYKLVAKKGKGADVRRYSLHAYVRPGQRVNAGDAIIASVVPEAVPLEAPSGEQYDFLADLDGAERETVYAAVKALGHLPELREHSADRLQHVLRGHDDALVQLEAAGALAHLGADTGWGYLQTILDSDTDQAVLMEAVLILAELKSDRSLTLLTRVADERANDPELRAAAAWGMA